MRHANSDTQKPSPTSHMECRVWLRHECDTPAACQSIGSRSSQDAKVGATIRNISMGGIGLTLDRRFERGTALLIECELAGEHCIGPFMARVVHATRQSDGSWLVGCAFARPLSGDDLAEFLDSSARSLVEEPLRPAGQEVPQQKT